MIRPWGGLVNDDSSLLAFLSLVLCPLLAEERHMIPGIQASPSAATTTSSRDRSSIMSLIPHSIQNI